MRTIGARLGTWIAVLVAGSVFASAAQAATVEVVDGTAVFTAAPGETNDLRMDRLTFADLGAPLVAGPGCEQIDANSARCSPGDDLPPSAVVSTGDGDDRVRASYYCYCPIALHGGSGNDNLVIVGTGNNGGELDGGAGNDVLISNEQLGGNDVLRGGPGDDVLRIEWYNNVGGREYGGDGDDELYYQGYPGGFSLPDRLVMDGGNGNDTYRFRDEYGQYLATAVVPGPGFDTLDESTADTNALGYGLDAIPFDLSLCPRCVERVIGTPSADVITGDDYAQEILGGDGNDAIDGGDGPDMLAGQGGDDTITSRDSVFDMVGCDGGLDTVLADPFDRISRDCETVSRRPAPKPGA